MRFRLDEVYRREAREERWMNYLLGVIDAYRAVGVATPAFRAVIHSDLPTGAGLSSSAALETATALVMESLSGIEQTVADRARHAISEMERVTQFATALERGDLAALGGILREGHDSLRDDYEVSCDELDFLVDSAYAFGTERGHEGSRMTGGGFGGSILSLVRKEAVEGLRTHLTDTFADRFGTRPNAFVTSAVDGASLHTVE